MDRREPRRDGFALERRRVGHFAAESVECRAESAVHSTVWTAKTGDQKRRIRYAQFNLADADSVG